MGIRACFLNLNSIPLKKALRIAQDKTKIKTQNYSNKKETKLTTVCIVTVIVTTCNRRQYTQEYTVICQEIDRIYQFWFQCFSIENIKIIFIIL